jgi:hypothetical protein
MSGALAEVPARAIVRGLADAAARFSDADFPPRVRVLDAIVARTGYTLPVVEYALDRLFETITEPALTATIAGELGSLDTLDRFVARDGRAAARALPVGPVCVVSSRTTIGVAIPAAVFALCAKCDVVVKDREDHLVAAFFAALAQEHDAFASAARAETWSGAHDARDLSGFTAVVAYGRNDTLAEIRAACPPEARFTGFGARASAGYVTRESLTDERAAAAIADGAARDLVLYESEGCLSLHALFVERGGNVAPDRFAALLAVALERAHVEFPPGERGAGASARLGSARALAAFRAASGAGSVYGDSEARHLLVVAPPAGDPPLLLPRALNLHPVDGPDEAAAYLRRHGIALEALAASGKREDVVKMAVDAGAARIAPFGALQSPQMEGNHGGRQRVTGYIRWITNDT